MEKQTIFKTIAMSLTLGISVGFIVTKIYKHKVNKNK